MHCSSRFVRLTRRVMRNPFTTGIAMGLMLNLCIAPMVMRDGAAVAQPQWSPSNPSHAPADAAPAPIDYELYQELFNFPRVVHEAVFGQAPKTNYLPYELDDQVTGVGPYTGQNGAGVPFSIEVTEIILDKDEIAADIARDPTVDDTTLQWMFDNNYEVYAFRGDLTGPAGTVDVIATVASTSGTWGEHHSFSVQSDPAYYDDPEAATWSGDASRDGGCSDAMDRAIDAFECPEPGEIEIDQDCVDAAFLAYDLGKAAAETDWQNAVATAKDIAAAAKAAMLANRIRKVAIALAKCAALALIPFAGSGLAARCALKEAAKIIAWEVGKRLAIKAALAAAIAYADEILAAALNALCDALVAGLEACFDCVEPDIEPEEPIDHEPQGFDNDR